MSSINSGICKPASCVLKRYSTSVKPPSSSDILLWAPDSINSDDEVKDKTGRSSTLQPNRSYLFASGDYISASHLTGSETVVSQGGSATITISSGKIECADGDVLYDLVLSDGTRYACAEGSGIKCFDSSGNNNHGTITAGDISTFHNTGYLGSDVANRHGYSDKLNLEILLEATVSASTPDPINYLIYGSDTIINGEYVLSKASTQTTPKPTTNFDIGVLNPENLTFFYCYSNKLNGSLPVLDSYQKLIQFQLQDNIFTGSIPNISACIKLEKFYCYYNYLTGDIPDLSHNTALTSFQCYHNNLTGYLGTSLPATLTLFSASYNALSQTAVDAILTQLDSAGASNGTVNLSGGTNAIPGTAGQTAVSSLNSKGWTVSVNS